MPNPSAAPTAPDHFDIVVGTPDVAPTGVARLAANGVSGAPQISVSGGAYSGLGGSESLPQTLLLADATTNTSPDGRIERHTTSGAAAAGFGLTDAVELQSDAGNRRRVMTDVTSFTTATDGAEVAKRTIQIMNAGALRDVATLDASGTALALLSPQSTATTPTAVLASTNATAQVSLHFRTSTSTLRSGLRADYLGNLTFFNGASGGTVAFDFLTNGDAGGLGGQYQTRILSNGHVGIQAPGASPPTDNGLMLQVFGRMGSGKGASVASANTVTLGADSNFFPISGTTTINGIVTTNWPPGSVITLQFAGILTLTHNSGAPGSNAVALKTTTAANVNTTANSIARFIYDGTFWVQLGPITPGY